MLTNNVQQVEKIDKLQANGRLNGEDVNGMEPMGGENGRQVVSEAKNKPPLNETLRNEMLKLLEKKPGLFDRSDLDVMTNDVAIAFHWHETTKIKGKNKFCTEKQAKRIVFMIRKGFLSYHSDWQIEMLTYQEAEDLLFQGEQNAINYNYKEK